MSEYYSQRNTNARQHNFYGNGVRVPVEGPRGPPGSVGPIGPRGRDGSDGNHGSDGNADFMLIETIGSTSSNASNEVGHLNWKVSGSVSMLADPYVIRQQGTSSHIHWGQHTVVTVGMLFKPGVNSVLISSIICCPEPTKSRQRS